ncbi:MAG: carbohydrate-binding domain-containing protein, partial [Pirellulaceae bacterium]
MPCRPRRRRQQPELSRPLHMASELLEPRMMLSTVQILAAGSENTEQMQLLIDEVVVETFDNIGGDPGPRIFESYVYNTAETVTIDQVRVQLINAQKIPPDIDSNLRVDAVIIDGVRFETEDPSVFSTGTWIPGQGFVPGFHQTEWLHTDGYFQYADTGTGGGSTIVINAAGSENTETMHLLIDGVVVQTWNNIGGDPGPRIFEAHVYNSGQTVTIDQIRVELSNAQRIPPDIDSNLRVDNVVLDGVVYETEDTSVFSTGTWVPGQGFVPGFHESEWLNTDGYFQFAASGSGGGSQIVVNAAGSEGDETMQLLIDGNVVST